MWVTGGEIVSQALSFMRNLIIARFITPEDFGIASTFALTLSLFEMFSNFAIDKFLIQNPKGGEPISLYTAQVMELGRNAINAFMLLLLAIPLAKLFGNARLAWAFALLAAVPFLRGWINLDICRFQRELRFRPVVWVELSSSIISTLLAIPLGFIFRDYRAMLLIVIAKSASYVAFTHIVAERRYSLAFAKERIREIWHFGWPLILNACVMFLIYQGDRLVIGSGNTIFHASKFNLTDLGLYAIGFALAESATQLLSKISNTILLPVLARSQDDLRQQGMLLDNALILTASIGSVVSAFFIIGGSSAVIFLYGHQYAGVAPIIGWIGAAQGLRILRVSPISVLLANGDTRSVLISNMYRAVALLCTIGIAFTGGTLSAVVFAAFIAENIAVLYCAKSVGHWSFRGWGVAIITFYAISIFAVLWKWKVVSSQPGVLDGLGVLFACIASGMVFLYGLRALLERRQC